MRNKILSLCLIGLSLFGCQSEKNENKPIVNTQQTAENIRVQEIPKEDSIQILMKKKTLKEAIEYVSGDFKEKFGETSDGTINLILWSEKNLSWNDVSADNETSFKLIKKDINSNRGKKMCVNGKILQISKQNNHEVYSGLLFNSNTNIVNFYSVKSTGNLVEGSISKFCGIVTELYDYENSGGGTTHAINIVGMFDLPENKK